MQEEYGNIAQQSRIKNDGAYAEPVGLMNRWEETFCMMAEGFFKTAGRALAPPAPEERAEKCVRDQDP